MGFEPDTNMLLLICDASNNPSFKNKRFQSYVDEYVENGLHVSRAKKITKSVELHYERVRNRRILKKNLQCLTVFHIFLRIKCNLMLEMKKQWDKQNQKQMFQPSYQTISIKVMVVVGESLKQIVVNWATTRIKTLNKQKLCYDY